MAQRSRALIGFIAIAVVLSLANGAYANLMFADNLAGNAAISATEKGVLQAAEGAWSSVFANINAANGKNTFTITWANVTTLDTGVLAVTSNQMADGDGIPQSANIVINQNSLTSDGFFVDPTPNDNSEFTQPDPKFPYYFAAKDDAKDPGTGQLVSLEIDLYSTILHEIGHALGMSLAYDKFGARLGAANPGGDRNFVFDNGDFAVISSNDEGSHVDQTQTGQLNGQPYDQLHDLMNPTVANGTRNLISPMDIAILTQGYGYTLAPVQVPEPGTFPIGLAAIALLLTTSNRRSGRARWFQTASEEI
jgi:hypothetical protein